MKTERIDKIYSLNIDDFGNCFFKIYFYIFVNIFFNLTGISFVVIFLLLNFLKRKPYLLFFIPFIPFLIAIEELLHILMFKMIYRVPSFSLKFVGIRKLLLARVEIIPDLPKENAWDFKVFILPPFFILSGSIFFTFIFYFLNLDKRFLIYPISGILYSLSSLIPLGPPIENDAFNAYKNFISKKERRKSV